MALTTSLAPGVTGGHQVVTSFISDCLMSRDRGPPGSQDLSQLLRVFTVLIITVSHSPSEAELCEMRKLKSPASANFDSDLGLGLETFHGSVMHPRQRHETMMSQTFTKIHEPSALCHFTFD